MGGKESEACGRCSMTTVISLTSEGEDGDGESGRRNPFEGARIEVREDQMRLVAAPAVVLGRVKRRLNKFASRITYGR